MPTRMPNDTAPHSVQTRMLRALVAFATIMAGAAIAVAQTVSPADPGIAEPGPTIGFAPWWWVVALVILALVVIGWAMKRRRPGPR